MLNDGVPMLLKGFGGPALRLLGTFPLPLRSLPAFIGLSGRLLFQFLYLLLR